MADDEQIERCARVCDAMIRELEGHKPKARKSQYDRQSPRQIDYAIRAIRRVAERVRALKGVTHEPTATHQSDGDKLAMAVAIANELRPVIAKSRDSAWRQEMLRRLNDLIG